VPSKGDTRRKAQARRSLTAAVKQLIAERLGFLNEPGFDPTLITDDQALFGRGLELDSIDAAEIAVAVQEKFNVRITDDNLGVFGSVNKLCDHIAKETSMN